MLKHKVIVSGGFHNVSSVGVMLDDSDFEGLFKDFPSRSCSADLLNYCDSVSSSTLSRLRRRFCGVDGCTCGSFNRAQIIF